MMSENKRKFSEVLTDEFRPKKKLMSIKESRVLLSCRKFFHFNSLKKTKNILGKTPNYSSVDVFVTFNALIK